MNLDFLTGPRMWAVADWHLGHRNIIKYCNRPFGRVDQMHDRMVELHNELVADDDIVFVLGDVCLSMTNLGPVSRMNGRKILVAGNHDGCWDGMKGGPDKKAKAVARYLDVGFELVVTSGIATGVALPSGREIVMSHLPYTEDDHGDRKHDRSEKLRPYRPADRGVPLVCGHVHDRWSRLESGLGTPMLNVGVDVREFKPTLFQDIDAMFDTFADTPAE